jgi:hypothetical protein
LARQALHHYSHFSSPLFVLVIFLLLAKYIFKNLRISGKETNTARSQWRVPVIQSIGEAEMREIKAQSQLR